MRHYVDGTLLIDQWHDQSAASYSADIKLSAGTHALRMEYYENQGDAVAALSWAKVTTERPVGNIITCVQPQNSWIKVYRWDGASWIDVNAIVRNDCRAWDRPRAPGNASPLTKNIAGAFLGCA